MSTFEATLSTKVHAVLVGCEYHGQKSYLPGCIYDTEIVEKFLKTTFDSPVIDILNEKRCVLPTKQFSLL